MRPPLHTSLAQILGSNGKAALLEALFLQSTGEPLWIRKLYRRTGMGMRGLAAQLRWLELRGVIRRRRIGHIDVIEADLDQPLTQALAHVASLLEEYDQITRSGPGRYSPKGLMSRASDLGASEPAPSCEARSSADTGS